jgi:hypothetical protein
LSALKYSGRRAVAKRASSRATKINFYTKCVPYKHRRMGRE